VGDDVLDLLGRAVCENAHCHSAAGLDCQLRPEILRVIIANDADLITAFEAETH